MEDRIDRRRDDVRAGGEALEHVVDRIAGPRVAGRGVDDAVGLRREHRVDVVRRDDAGPADAREVAGVAADLRRIRDEHAREREVLVRQHGADRRLADVPGSPDDDA
jgi:hypothetical protein